MKVRVTLVSGVSIFEVVVNASDDESTKRTKAQEPDPRVVGSTCRGARKLHRLWVWLEPPATVMTTGCNS